MLDKKKIINNLPSQQRRGKKKKRPVLDDEELDALREETFSTSYPEISDQINPESEQQVDTSSANLTTEFEKESPSSKEIGDQPAFQTDTESKPNAKGKSRGKTSKNTKNLGNCTSVACYKDKVDRVRLVCTLLKNKQYEFVDSALTSYHNLLEKRGDLDMTKIPIKTSKNTNGSNDREFLQCSISVNHQAKIDALLLGVPKYELISMSIDHYFKVLKKKGLLPDQIVDLLKL